MSQPIEAILFDMGGTLRSSVAQDEAHARASIERIAQTIGASLTADEMRDLLAPRAKAYGRWARQAFVELKEQDLWTQWMLPDWPPEQIAPAAVQLNQLWREAIGKRVIFPEVKETLPALFRRGYRLGLVSNTTSSVEVPAALRELQLAGCIETTLLSCVVGMRKPDPAILLSAARRMGVAPERCAYVGDRLNRDVEAARKAGFARVVIRRGADFDEHRRQHSEWGADMYIDNLGELLEIFPARRQPEAPEIYRVSLSTMWARKNFPDLNDFFEAARRLGFSHVELNHQVDSAMLAPVNLNGYHISSVHEPCPADISTDQLKERDWLISSPDEDRRTRGVEAIKHSIDLAAQLGAPSIVVHCGMIMLDLSAEKQLRALYEKNKNGNFIHSPEYRVIRKGMDETRAALIGPRIASVKKSLKELLDYARPRRVRLGLENRYHYFDIPSPNEMGELLALAGPDELGFVYDVGHAQALDRLGFYAREEWLQRFAQRIIEVHLHDVQGVNDHFAPGLGEVDYSLLAACLPADAIRTFEVQASNTPEQVRAGLQYLAERGIVQRAE